MSIDEKDVKIICPSCGNNMEIIETEGMGEKFQEIVCSCGFEYDLVKKGLFDNICEERIELKKKIKDLESKKE